MGDCAPDERTGAGKRPGSHLPHQIGRYMEFSSFTSSPAGRMRLIAAASLASAAFVIGAVPSLASASSPAGKFSGPGALRKAVKQDPNIGTRSKAVRQAQRLGYLVPNHRRYERQKAR